MTEINPLISIVIPCYNHGSYLAEAILSIKENAPENIEIIVINDGSTDSTKEVLSQYNDSRVRAFNTENQGIAEALNFGFSKSRGSYLTWSSADNLYQENALSKMLDFLQQNPSTDFVYADVQLIDDSGIAFKNSNYRVADQDSEDNSILRLPVDTENLWQFADNFINACFLYRRKIRDLAGKYRKEYLGFEDYEYWLKITHFSKLEKIKSSQPLYKYRLHQNSLTSTLCADSLAAKQREIVAKHRKIHEDKKNLLEKFDSFSTIEKALNIDHYVQGSKQLLEAKSDCKNQALSYLFTLKDSSSNRIIKRARTTNYQAVTSKNPVAFFFSPISENLLNQVCKYINNNENITFVSYCENKEQRKFSDVLNLAIENNSNYRIIDTSNETFNGELIQEKYLPLMYVLSCSNLVLDFSSTFEISYYLRLESLIKIAALAGLPFVSIAEDYKLLKDPNIQAYIRDCSNFFTKMEEAISIELDYSVLDDWLQTKSKKHDLKILRSMILLEKYY